MIEHIWITLDETLIQEHLKQLQTSQFYHDTQQQEPTNSATNNALFTVFYPCTSLVEDSSKNDDKQTRTLKIDVQIKKHDGKRYILAPNGQMLVRNNTENSQPTETAMTKALHQAIQWQEQINQQKIGIKQFAKELQVKDSFMYQPLKLLNLSPQIIQLITSNTLSPLIRMQDLYKASETLCWKKQHTLLNIKQPITQS